jgi:hypothetical protein
MLGRFSIQRFVKALSWRSSVGSVPEKEENETKR